MAAGLGFKTFNTGDVLSASDVNGYLMQGVLVFASTAARDAAITAPAEGQFAFTKDTNSLFYYDGAVWVASGATGDIEGVTAGTGISGGGTSGTVTITNSMATAIDAKGDLVVGTGADTFSRLAAGTNGYLLTADSAEATGLKWAAAAGGSGMTLLSTTTLSGTSTTVSITDTGYINLFFIVSGVTSSGSYADVAIRYNTVTTGYYGVNSADSRTDNVRVTNATQLDTGVDQSVNATNGSNLLTFNINNYANTGFHAVQWLKTYFTDTSAYRIAQGIGFNANTSAITSVTFVSATTINAGTVKVYGVK